MCNRCQKPHPRATARHLSEHRPVCYGKGPRGSISGYAGTDQIHQWTSENKGNRLHGGYGPARTKGGARAVPYGGGIVGDEDHWPTDEHRGKGQQEPPQMIPLLNADGSPMFINGQKVYAMARTAPA